MRALSLAFVALCPAGTFAQEAIGHVSGTLQGYETEWFVTSSVEGGQSSWGGDEEYAWVGIMGHATANTVLETGGAIWLSFEMVPEAGGWLVLAREIGYYRSPGAYYASQGDAPEIQVVSAVFDDGQLTVAGIFGGTLGLSPDFGETADMEDSRQLQGEFEARLLLLE